jgi:transcriptional regulator with XRE-family HTH domain
MPATHPPRVTDACFGEALRVLRWMKGIRRASLAAACGLSERGLADRERGVRPLMATELVDVCQALAIPLAHAVAVAEGLSRLTALERAALMRAVIRADERAERRSSRCLRAWALLAASVAIVLIATSWPEAYTAADLDTKTEAEHVWCQWCPPLL